MAETVEPGGYTAEVLREQHAGHRCTLDVSGKAFYCHDCYMWFREMSTPVTVYEVMCERMSPRDRMCWIWGPRSGIHGADPLITEAPGE